MGFEPICRFAAENRLYYLQNHKNGGSVVMKVAASMSVGRLAPKHSLDIDGIRAISPNVTPSLIKDDVVIIDRLKRPDGSHMTIEEYTDQTFQPYIDQYNSNSIPVKIFRASG